MGKGNPEQEGAGKWLQAGWISRPVLGPGPLRCAQTQAAGCRVCMAAFQTLDYGDNSTAITPGTVDFAHLTGGLASYFSCCLIVVQEANFPNSSISELVSRVILTAIIIVKAL